jgi:hypothetical protein
MTMTELVFNLNGKEIMIDCVRFGGRGNIYHIDSIGVNGGTLYDGNDWRMAKKIYDEYAESLKTLSANYPDSKIKEYPTRG